MFDDWCYDLYNIVEYKVVGRFEYLKKQCFLSVYDEGELKELEKCLEKFKLEKERREKEKEINKVLNDKARHEREEEEKLNDLKRQKQREENTQKFFNNDHIQAEATDDLIDTINNTIEYAADKNLLYYTNLIRKLKDYINEFKDNKDYKKLNVKETSEIDDEDHIEFIKTFCKKCFEYNYNKYIRGIRIRTLIMQHLNQLLDTLVGKRKELESDSKSKRREKNNDWGLKKKFCDCCNKEVSSRNWADHIATQKHLNKVNS
jgi:hypothetical protein